MTFSDDIKEALAKPLNPEHVASRQQAGQKLDYIESWHAIAEANRIFGFDGWDSETVHVNCVSEKERKIGKNKDREGFSVTYTAKVRISVNGVVREGTGAGSGIDADLGLAHESAIKEAESDARKRALMTFGNPFGLALYDKSRANVQEAPPPSVELFLDGLTKALRENRAGEYWAEHWPNVPDKWRTYVKTEKEKLKAANDQMGALAAG